MKKIITTACMLTAMLFLTACSDPKFDSSSEESRKNSSKAILESLPDEKKEEFKKALFTIAMFTSFGSKNSEGLQEAIAAKLDGKTANEILTLAAELKEKTNKK